MCDACSARDRGPGPSSSVPASTATSAVRPFDIGDLLVPTEPRQEASVCQTPGVQAMMRPVRTAREGEPIQVTVYGAGAIGGDTRGARARARPHPPPGGLAPGPVAGVEESGPPIETPA